ncbi:hypothetical protein SAMN05421544_10936 [Riemerella columbipharyngis]|uniref:Lipoprotein n=1 Tax=Riemerella columbipharyngis TaxID=1071918 RepID=A0A1G7CVN1_9FLAO|nr:hypothetical protein SAMN05421544_10936 [Riemerella columbipharyngis]
MYKIFYLFFLCFLICFSCSVEKVNLSPLSKELSKEKIEENTKELINTDSIDKIRYTSDITNTMAEIPEFQYIKINSAIAQMKQSLSDYIYARKANDQKAKYAALNEIKEGYRLIQKLRKMLSRDDDAKLNVYLVKIKTDISMLESRAFFENINIQ